ncbi:MAG: carboxypeptidase-like regulatory domain-containing protein [Polyangiales bacterium]
MRGSFLVVLAAVGLVACGGGDGSENLNGTGDDLDGSIDDAGDGSTGLDPDGGVDGMGCTPRTCDMAMANCGPVADGCGGLIDCGKCPAPSTCGGGGTPSVCGGTSGCKPQTCTDLGAKCGPQGDGCGSVIDCGTCPSGESCGGGGTPNVCGKSTGGDGGVVCTAKSCTTLGYNCGPAADGCGKLIDCGTCTKTGEICGGAGKPNVCGTGTTICTPKTCATAGANCGPIADGCGGVVASCGTCTAPDICGGGGKPSVCGGGTTDTGPAPCVGLECAIPTCAAGVTTSISGTVYDPAGKVPLYNVYVYVPNAAVTKFTDGATCDKCADALSGKPITWTVTDTKGQFKLTGVPAGASIPLVIQSGKWRRQIKVPVTGCKDNPVVDKNLTRLPKNKSEGDIPKIALTTGGADPLECLLRKIGIDDAEFTNPTGTGRVNLFKGSGGAGTYSAGGTFPNATTLWDTEPHLGAYDVVLFACEGAQNIGTKPATARQALVDYTKIGGRVFASHWHNVWIDSGPAPWPTTATFNFQPDLVDPITAKIDMTFTKGSAMADWLVNVGASTVKGDLQIKAAQHTVDAVNASTSTRWIYANGVKDLTGATIKTSVQYYTFNTPVGVPVDSQCGRVVFSDIHVSSADKINRPFPTGCVTTDLSPQEKALEFMLFDLTSRVCDDKTPPPPPKCTPLTCTDLGLSCGPGADGCGKILDCGTCASPMTCGGGGVVGKCGTPPAPRSRALRSG